MKATVWLPAASLGLLVGWFLRSISLHPSLSAGEVLNAGATLAAGWWIQRTLSRQAQLGRIPLDAVERLLDRLDVLVLECLSVAASVTLPLSPQPDILAKLRVISNEIIWLGEVIDALDIAETEHEHLQSLYLQFKQALTESQIQHVEAERIGREFRALTLRIRWIACGRILSSPEDFGPFSEETESEVYR